LSSDKEVWFLWPEKDNPVQQLREKRHDLQFTGAKENNSVFNNLFSPDNVTTIEYKSSTLKNSTFQAVFENFTQELDNTHSRKVPNQSPKVITFTNDADSLITKARYRLQIIIRDYSRIQKITCDCSLFWKSLAQSHTVSRALPLDTFKPASISKSYQLIQEGIG
jgi:hypothetical protein